ncbi:MAG TPA: PadR family transcriptional regulator [Actinotalea sp.]|nr:PadR family transcriptional regulator [Actinotalea sp.]
MSEQAYLVLLALSDQPRHGYGIVQEVLAISAGDVRLAAGTLYGVLDRLLLAGLVAEDREEIVDGRLRRYYLLTPEGGSAASAETARLAALARRGRQVLGRPALGGAG